MLFIDIIAGNTIRLLNYMILLLLRRAPTHSRKILNNMLATIFILEGYRAYIALHVSVFGFLCIKQCGVNFLEEMSSS